MDDEYSDDEVEIAIEHDSMKEFFDEVYSLCLYDKFMTHCVICCRMLLQ